MSSTATLLVRTPNRLHRPMVAPHRLARFGLLTELCRPRDVFANLTPNWFASVMGTGIVAIAAAALPVQFPGLHALRRHRLGDRCQLACPVTAATVLHWLRHPATARSHRRNPVMAHFYGAPPMAF